MKNILLVGVGRFGRHIAVQLTQLGHQVMAVDTSEDRINDVLPFVTNAQIGDSTNADFLRTLGIGNYDVCIVTISGNFQNSLETTSLLKELGAKCVVSSSLTSSGEIFTSQWSRSCGLPGKASGKVGCDSIQLQSYL